jgi:hypothetical protein
VERHSKQKAQWACVAIPALVLRSYPSEIGLQLYELTRTSINRDDLSGYEMRGSASFWSRVSVTKGFIHVAGSRGEENGGRGQSERQEGARDKYLGISSSSDVRYCARFVRFMQDEVLREGSR